MLPISPLSPFRETDGDSFGHLAINLMYLGIDQRNHSSNVIFNFTFAYAGSVPHLFSQRRSILQYADRALYNGVLWIGGLLNVRFIWRGRWASNPQLPL